MTIVSRRRDIHSITSIQKTPLPLASVSSTKKRNRRSIATSRSLIFDETNSNNNKSNNNKPWMIYKRSYSSSPTLPSYLNEERKIIQDYYTGWKLITCILIMLFPWIPNYSSYQILLVKQQSANESAEVQDELLDKLRNFTIDIEEAKDILGHIESRNDHSYDKLKKLHGAIDLESNKYLEAEQMEEKYLKRITDIEKTIQRKDKSIIEET